VTRRWNQCDVCGRFIAYADFATRKAGRRLVKPDTPETPETYETLCKEHAQADRAEREERR